MATKQYEYAGFTRIDIGSAMQFEIIQSNIFSTIIYADDFRNIRVEQIGETLKIGRQGIEWLAPFRSQPRIRITLPVLLEVLIHGASRGLIEGFQVPDDMHIRTAEASHLEARHLELKNIHLEVSSASGLTGDIKLTGDARIDINAASRIELFGKANDIRVRASGAASVDLGKFVAQNAEVELSGASNATVSLSGTLNANVNGASNLAWTGNPSLGNVVTSGASTLRCKQ